ncbi:MAG: hypothetical protein ABWY93_18650 [Mycobacterium sp.]
MTEYAWQPAGHHQRVHGNIDRIPDFDPRSGDHLWTIATMYRWGGPTVETPTLDTENLLLLAGPGCYYCEQPYHESIARRRCKGPGRS